MKHHARPGRFTCFIEKIMNLQCNLTLRPAVQRRDALTGERRGQRFMVFILLGESLSERRDFLYKLMDWEGERGQ